MVRYEFGLTDLARLRFAISPMWELVISLRGLRDPARAPMHLPWVREVRERVRGLDLLPLMGLVSLSGYIPDFLTPPPNTPLASFEDELEAIRTTPAARVRTEVALRIQDGLSPDLGEPFLKRPERALRRLADSLAAYWEVALEPHWPRVRALLEADLLYRSRRLTEGGPTALFADLDPGIEWRANGLEVEVAYDTTVGLEGRGLLLVPTVFPARPAVITSSYWQPSVMYPARGVALLWESGQDAPPEALAAVLGRGRAAVLLALDAPRTTGDVARRLEITPGGASQHLSSLKAAGLVSSRRHGRSVLYARSPLADDLVGAAGAGAVPHSPTKQPSAQRRR
jgi:DNA-binding transcriptional ArsR family regulator